MEFVLTATTLIVVLIPVIIIMAGHIKKLKSMKELLTQFSKIGIDKHITLSSQEVLNRTVFGVDGKQGKVFIVSTDNSNNFSDMVVDLKDVKACSVKKVFGKIGAGELKRNNLNDHLISMSLHFELEKSNIEIPFFSSNEDHLKKLPELEQKALNWKTILSKMLKGKNNSSKQTQILSYENN